MKIAIDIGHNVKCDRGAMGIVPEDKLTKQLGDKVIALLRLKGHSVVFVTPESAKSLNHSLQQRVDKANQHDCDLFVSLHFNAFYGKAFGTEVYARSSRGLAVASKVQREICKLGFYDRKVKKGNYYVLRKTNMPAILVECCFCDSLKDMYLYDANDMAIAICNGILGVKGSYVPRKKVLTLTVNHDTWIKGCVEEAINLSEVKSNSRILEDYKRKLLKGVYTIVDMNPLEEAHYYVLLKSGLAGYVYHGHVEIK